MKMKSKILGVLAGAVFLAIMALNVNLVLSSSKSIDRLSRLLSVEKKAQAQSEKGNTGPGETVDCTGWGTGTKKICESTSPYPCTESSCS